MAVAALRLVTAIVDFPAALVAQSLFAQRGLSAVGALAVPADALAWLWQSAFAGPALVVRPLALAITRTLLFTPAPLVKPGACTRVRPTPRIALLLLTHALAWPGLRRGPGLLLLPRLLPQPRLWPVRPALLVPRLLLPTQILSRLLPSRLLRFRLLPLQLLLSRLRLRRLSLLTCFARGPGSLIAVALRA